jgi:hypothetical protein
MKQCCWNEGEVDLATDHFQLRWAPDAAAGKGDSTPLALVGRASDREFIVEFLGAATSGPNRERAEAIRRELDYYLVAKGEPNPWGYAQYHCSRAANLYSKVRWTFSAGEADRFEFVGPLAASRNHLAQFRSGVLLRAWARAYPMLFSRRDLELALAQRRNHYFEWLVAIVLYHTEGLLSIQKYEFPVASRPRRDTVERLLGPNVCSWLRSRQRQRVVQCPDLLAFTPDLSGPRFYEAKGPTDSLRPNQKAFFNKLSLVTSCPIKIVTFSWLNDRQDRQQS